MSAKEIPQKKAPRFYDNILNVRIRDLLSTRRIKTEDFANALGISAEAVRLWCAGYSRPDIDKLNLISNFFSVSTDYLLGKTKIATSWEQEQSDYYSLSQHVKSLYVVMGILKEYVEAVDTITIPASVAEFYGKEPGEDYTATAEEFYFSQLPHLLKSIKGEYKKSLEDKHKAGETNVNTQN